MLSGFSFDLVPYPFDLLGTTYSSPGCSPPPSPGLALARALLALTRMALTLLALTLAGVLWVNGGSGLLVGRHYGSPAHGLGWGRTGDMGVGVGPGIWGARRRWR